VDTIRIVQSLKSEGFDVRVRVRKASAGRGLSSAVLLGLQEEAKYDVFLVMDADLQHEPESVPAVLDPVLKGVADFSVVCIIHIYIYMVTCEQTVHLTHQLCMFRAREMLEEALWRTGP